MTWPQHIERWRQFANWESKDIPTDLILAIIDHESGGRAGIKSQANTKSAAVPMDSGETVTVNNALGLMQILPAHIAAWNEHKTPKITLEDMTGNDERAARLQIRIGSSIFASYVQKLHQFDPVEFPGDSPGKATPDQLSLALVAYAIGPGKKGGEKGLIPKLEQLRAQRKPLTLESLRTTFPKWGYSERKARWINRPVQAAKTVWTDYIEHASSASPTAPTGHPRTLAAKIFSTEKKDWSDWLLPVAIIGAILFFGRKDLGLDGLFKN
jgi:hypothetical protein